MTLSLNEAVKKSPVSIQILVHNHARFLRLPQHRGHGRAGAHQDQQAAVGQPADVVAVVFVLVSVNSIVVIRSAVASHAWLLSHFSASLC